MKKYIILILTGIIALSLVACSSKPSLAEVEKAIQSGTVTVEDAFSKGWVNEVWVDEYNKAKDALSVPASNKMNSNMIGDFETTTQSGETFSNSDLNKVTFFAFINPNSDAGKEAYNILVENYDAIIADSGDVLIINTSNETSDLFAESKFPVVLYNDSVVKALGSLTEMVNEDGFSGSWNGSGAFLTAWSSKIDGESLISSMTAIIDMMG